jgi:hypothetical protein
VTRARVSGLRRVRKESFRQGLRASGFVDGQNIAIDIRHAQGGPQQLPELAAEFPMSTMRLWRFRSGSGADLIVSKTEEEAVAYVDSVTELTQVSEREVLADLSCRKMIAPLRSGEPRCLDRGAQSRPRFP